MKAHLAFIFIASVSIPVAQEAFSHSQTPFCIVCLCKEILAFTIVCMTIYGALLKRSRKRERQPNRKPIQKVTVVTWRPSQDASNWKWKRVEVTVCSPEGDRWASDAYVESASHPEEIEQIEDIFGGAVQINQGEIFVHLVCDPIG